LQGQGDVQELSIDGVKETIDSDADITAAYVGGGALTRKCL
jgi:hypothetical protein